MSSNLLFRSMAVVAVLITGAVAAPHARAFDFQGDKALVAVTADGQRLSIGPAGRSQARHGPSKPP